MLDLILRKRKKEWKTKGHLKEEKKTERQKDKRQKDLQKDI